MEIKSAIRQSILPGLSFLLLGLMWLFSGSRLESNIYLFGALAYIPIALMFLTLGIGWVKEFPKWTIISIGFCLLVSFYFTNVSVAGSDLLEFWAYLPLALTIVVSVIIRPSIKPISTLLGRLIKEPDSIIYLLYGLLPLGALAVSDEVNHTFAVPFILLITLIEILGIVLYLSSNSRLVKYLSLIVSMIVVILISFYISEHYGANHF
jgi:hypothetical protein